MICKKEDRDVPGLICGYPIPCPYHTVTIDLAAQPVPTVTIPVTAEKHVDVKMLRKLKAIARVMDIEEDP